MRAHAVVFVPDLSRGTGKFGYLSESPIKEIKPDLGTNIDGADIKLEGRVRGRCPFRKVMSNCNNSRTVTQSCCSALAIMIKAYLSSGIDLISQSMSVFRATTRCGASRLSRSYLLYLLSAVGKERCNACHVCEAMSRPVLSWM